MVWISAFFWKTKQVWPPGALRPAVSSPLRLSSWMSHAICGPPHPTQPLLPASAPPAPALCLMHPF